MQNSRGLRRQRGRGEHGQRRVRRGEKVVIAAMIWRLSAIGLRLGGLWGLNGGRAERRGGRLTGRAIGPSPPSAASAARSPEPQSPGALPRRRLHPH